MAYTPPNTFVTNTTLVAADVQENVDDLRIYLHEDIIAGDLASAKIVNTRHIQPPYLIPYTNLLHGVSGYQGGQQSPGMLTRITFCTKFLCGNGMLDVLPSDWQIVPSTSFKINIRKACTVVFHWWCDIYGGPDTSTGANTFTQDTRFYYITPFVSSVGFPQKPIGQWGRNATTGFNTTLPAGSAEIPYTVNAGYHQRAGTFMNTTTAGTEYTIGLCTYSAIDRVAVFNWSIALEVFYL